MFLGAASGGLVALARSPPPPTSAPPSTPSGSSYSPPWPSWGWLVAFDRALQAGIEDYGYAQRIARLRGYYFQHAPELVDYPTQCPAD